MKCCVLLALFFVVSTFAEWTEWYDRDDPTGAADNEGIEYEPVHPCKRVTPLDARCARIVDGLSWDKTGQFFQRPCGVTGIVCVNTDNRPFCDDYKVKYLCPSDVPTTAPTTNPNRWTQSFNRDDPTGGSDDEGIESLPVHPCNGVTPLDVSCIRVIDGASSDRTGQVFSRPCGVKGLICVNADNYGMCDDYEVQYLCPPSTTTTTTTTTATKRNGWTQWYDRDDPNLLSDDEGIESEPVHPCNGLTPLNARCIRVRDQRPSEKTGQVFSRPCGVQGLICLNADNEAGCDDYAVEYLCPSPITPSLRTCYSVGDPHVKRFDGFKFDSHSTGWKTLYKYGLLEIQVEQVTWSKTGSGVAINRAVRYSTNGGTTWDETVEGGKRLYAGIKTFTNPAVVLRVETADYSIATWAKDKFIYHVFIKAYSHNTLVGASGQCVPSIYNLRRRLVAGVGVAFPSGSAVKVTKQEAEAACTGLKEEMQNCMTDVRMANDPVVTHLIKKDFVKVEEIVYSTFAEVAEPLLPGTEPPAPAPAFVLVVPGSGVSTTTTTTSGVSTTTQCLSALAMLVLLAL